MTTKILRFIAFIAAAAALAAAEPSSETFQKLPDKPVDLIRDRNLYAVGYAHLDTQWRWTYAMTIREFIANTLHDNFALFQKYPNYIFNFSGSRRYEMMEEYYPADFAKMKEYVAAGRWFPAGSSVDEADAIAPSGESLVRHVLYGNRYFRREFGKASDEFMLPDCFGFPAALPSILAHAGIKGFSTQKLTWGSATGIPFKVGVWAGPDGRSVVAALDPGNYAGDVTSDLSRSESWLKRIEATGKISGAFADYHYYGTGDNGGAPKDGSVRWIERSLAGSGPVRVISATADQMFKDLLPEQIAKLPRYQGELLLTEHSAGSITSAATMKRWNRKNEQLADGAERASVAAAWLGGAPYPSKKLYGAWDLLLGSQMHDMLPGTCHPKAYEYCWNDEILAANQFASVLEDAAGTVTGALDTRGDGVALVVYNPLSFEREDIVEAEVVFPGAAPAALAAIGPDGESAPVQIVGRAGNTLNVLFLARMPSVGFAVYRLQQQSPAPIAASQLAATTGTLENLRYRLTLDTEGNVASLIDKTTGRELLSAPARLSFQYEKPAKWPAWNMDWADRQKPPRAFVAGPVRVRVSESGPVRVAIEIEREAQGSRFIQTIRLGAGDAGDRVEFANHIDWQTTESSLKAAFPLSIANPLATYDSQLGTVVRGNNNPLKYEVPQHQWFDLTAPDGSRGVAVLNDSKFGSDKPDDSTLRLTLLYTPGNRGDFQDQAVQDFGRHDILYALAAHVGDWRQGGVPAQAARLNQPLRAFQSPAHPGLLGRVFSLLRLSSGQVTLQSVKKAEDGDEIVIRLRELTGRPAVGMRLAAAAPIEAAREIDGQERALGTASVTQGELAFDLTGYGLRAFALKLAAAPAKLDAPAFMPLTLPCNDIVASTNANRAGGRFDGAGNSFPAEQLPAKLVSEGVEFNLAPTAGGRPNAMAARKQTLTLPEGRFNRLYLLAAADGDTSARFLIDGKPVDLTIQNWNGTIGQWDKRLWAGNPPDNVYNWIYPFAGLVPGFTKRDPVAWFCSHHHCPQGNAYYQYCYLFKYRIDLPDGAKTVTLPDNPRVRIFAATAALTTHDDVKAAGPLYDRLDDHTPDAPTFSPAGGTFADATTVTIAHPLYWHDGGLRYTLDGSEPVITSPAYTQPLLLSGKATLKARQFDASGRPGPVSTATFEIADTTPPTAVSAAACAPLPFVRVLFSEPVEKASAELPGNYRLSEPVEITGATLAADGLSVMLCLDGQVDGSGVALTVSVLRDRSPNANVQAAQTIKVQTIAALYRHTGSIPSDGAEIKVPNLPVGLSQAWTMNVFVRSSQMPGNRTLIAGFGRCDGKADYTGRYFGTFAKGLRLWMAGSSWGRDFGVESIAPLALDRWQMLTANYDGQFLRIYQDGRQIGWTESIMADDEAVVRLLPIDPWDKQRRFQGEIRDFTVWGRVLSEEALQLLLRAGPEN
ncbi:MAG: glycoside hydrolase family 38 C-terminal domain-containing protein [Opitutaceae bacterium]|jgi:alpha-mannosidase